MTIESNYRELLLGCGRSRIKRVDPRGAIQPWQNLTTLDVNPDVNPDILHDLDSHNLEAPSLYDVFERDTFNEVHAYEVLEHLGSQGNVTEFFWIFFQIWSVLKPGGVLCGTTPSRFSGWLWGDPGHRRVILPESLQFLQQPFYAQCDGPHPTMASDYRSIWRGDFEVRRSSDDHKLHTFVLEAIKPARKAPYVTK